MSLSEKLIIYFMLLSMGAIGIVGIYSYLSARNALMERTYNQLATVRYLKKKDIETFYLDRVKDAKALVSDPGITRHVTGKTGIDDPVLQKMLDQRNYYRRIWILSKEHTEFMMLPTSDYRFIPSKVGPVDQSLLEGYKMGREAIITDLIRDTLSKLWIQLVIVPIDSAGKPVHFLALEFSSEAIDELMPDQNPLNGLGKSGEAYLVGDDRKLRSNSRFIPEAILRTEIDTATSRLAFSGNDGTWLMKDYRGIPVLGSFSLLRAPSPRWAVIAEIDLEEAMIPIYSIRNNVIFITVFIATIVFAVTWIIARRITRPVITLKNAALELGKGKLGTQVEVSTNDEIGELASTFNLMSEQLKESDALLNQERARRMRAAFDGQDIERQRLSRELHDGLGQSLIAQKLRLESLKTPDEELYKGPLDDLKVNADQLVDEVRRISNALMPAQLMQFGLVSALRQHCEEVSRYGHMEVCFDATGDYEYLSKKTRTYLFRIVQEALTNILKHSQAGTASVGLAHTKDHLFLSISDNGRGFNPELVFQGNGLNNMRERTGLLHGTMSINSAPGKGSTIEIQIPTKA